MTFFDRSRLKHSRRRRSPTFGVESLEGRQLLAASPVAATLDGGGLPVYFSIQADGSVAVNLSYSLNNSTPVNQPSAAQILSGLKASSIAAFTDATGEPAVAATTASSSYVSVDRYVATGNLATPFVWTGWQQLGNFVATSVVAASNGTSGAAVFAIGADSHVYEDAYAPSSGSSTSQWTGFQQVGGTAASTISVVADKPGTYEVAALTGPSSYVEGTEAVDAGGTITSAPFAQLGNFVASSINLTPGLNQDPSANNLGDRLFLFAVGGGVLYDDFLTVDASTGRRISTTYSPLGDPTQIGGAVTASAVVVSSYPSPNFLTVMALVGGTGAIVDNEFDATATSLVAHLNNQWTLSNHMVGSGPVNAPLSFQATALVGVGSSYHGTTDYLSEDSSGNARVTSFTSVPTQLPQASWAVLPTSGAHPIAAGLLYGTPVLVELGSDGTVYMDMTKSALAYAGQSTPNPNGSFGTGEVAQFKGFQALPGLKATSIGVVSQPDGRLDVLALTGAQSYVYSFEIYATGENNRLGEVGWNQVGTVVATSIQGADYGYAPYQGSIPTAIGATAFALGVNNVVYAATATPFSNFTDFAPLPGLSVASFSVHAVGSQVLVAALTGSQSYAYANLYTPPTSTDPSKSTGWTLAGKAIMKTVVASESPTGVPVVAGTDLSNGEASISLSTNLANAPASNTDNEQYYPNHGGNSLVPLVYPSSTGVVYVSQTSSTTLSLQGVLPGVNQNPAGSSLGYFQLGTLQAAVPLGAFVPLLDGTSPYIFVSGEDGLVDFVQGFSTGNPKNPYLFTTFTSLGGYSVN